jgi:lysophospholipase L1-like esterase
MFSLANFFLAQHLLYKKARVQELRKHLLYCNLYRSFLYNNSPDPSLYAPSDGLHLSFAGTDLLRKKIINIIRHLSRYYIYSAFTLQILNSESLWFYKSG